MMAKTVLLTGAAGNLGTKLRPHLAARYTLRLLDRDPRGDPAIVAADLAFWSEDWVRQFEGVDCVVHLAANAEAGAAWPELVESNLDAVVHVFLAAARARVGRVVFASSNHVLGGYKDEHPVPRLTAELPPRPGTRYVAGGERRDSTPYGATKLFGERVGRCFAEATGLSVIVLRIGWVRPGANRVEDLPRDREPWFRLMWLSTRDLCQLVERAIEADPGLRFAILNGVSANTGTPWDLEAARRLVGYEPRDDVARP